MNELYMRPTIKVRDGIAARYRTLRHVEERGTIVTNYGVGEDRTFWAQFFPRGQQSGSPPEKQPIDRSEIPTDIGRVLGSEIKISSDFDAMFIEM
tara:strand:+ start:1264 stop:1548 length:285 start_codon:yes stop_codon:yes gene_type:complete